jgi:hypothetical protein
MPAVLERNEKDGKPISSNVPPREVIRCLHEGCEFSYTLSYTDAENYMHGSEKNTDRMLRMAAELVQREHPTHLTRIYLWKAVGRGPECRWFEADSSAARAAL